MVYSDKGEVFMYSADAIFLHISDLSLLNLRTQNPQTGAAGCMLREPSLLASDRTKALPQHSGEGSRPSALSADLLSAKLQPGPEHLFPLTSQFLLQKRTWSLKH